MARFDVRLYRGSQIRTVSVAEDAWANMADVRLYVYARYKAGGWKPLPAKREHERDNSFLSAKIRAKRQKEEKRKRRLRDAKRRRQAHGLKRRDGKNRSKGGAWSPKGKRILRPSEQ